VNMRPVTEALEEARVAIPTTRPVALAAPVEELVLPSAPTW